MPKKRKTPRSKGINENTKTTKWNQYQTEILVLLIKKHGFGNYTSILEDGVLYMKDYRSLDAHLHRLAATQKIGFLKGFHVDPRIVRRVITDQMHRHDERGEKKYAWKFGKRVRIDGKEDTNEEIEELLKEIRPHCIPEEVYSKIEVPNEKLYKKCLEKARNERLLYLTEILYKIENSLKNSK